MCLRGLCGVDLLARFRARANKSKRYKSNRNDTSESETGVSRSAFRADERQCNSSEAQSHRFSAHQLLRKNQPLLRLVFSAKSL